MQKYAFFDVDNTIYSGYTVADVILHLSQASIISANYSDEFMKLYKSYKAGKVSYGFVAQASMNLLSQTIKGLDEKEVLSAVDDMLKGKEKAIFDWVKPTLSSLKGRGYKVIFISAGPNFVISKIADMLDIKSYYATEMKSSDGKFIGGEPEILNDKKKTELIRKILNEEVDQETSTIAFGDSNGDIPMLELANQAFVYNNSQNIDMIEMAESKGWKVFTSASEVIELI